MTAKKRIRSKGKNAKRPWQYPLDFRDEFSYKAVQQLARERGTKLETKLAMRDIILSSLLLDRDFIKVRARLIRAAKGTKK